MWSRLSFQVNDMNMQTRLCSRSTRVSAISLSLLVTCFSVAHAEWGVWQSTLEVEWVKSLAISGNGKVLATSGHDGTIQLWDLADGSSKRRATIQLTSHLGKAACLSVALSPDGKHLAACNGHEVTLWNTARQEKLWAVRDEVSSAYGVAFSPDGKAVAVVANKRILVLDATTGKPKREPLREKDNPSAYICVAFSPNGRLSAAEYCRQQIPGLVKEAEALYAQGRYHEAAEHFQKAEYRRGQLADIMAKFQLERIEPKYEAKGTKVVYRLPDIENEPLQTIWQSGLMTQLVECGAVVIFRLGQSGRDEEFDPRQLAPGTRVKSVRPKEFSPGDTIKVVLVNSAIAN